MKKTKANIKKLFETHNAPVLEMGGDYCSDVC